MKRILLFLICLALFGKATRVTSIGTSETDIETTTVKLTYLYLANTTASAITITLRDKSTDCSAAACQPWPAVSIPAHTVYAYPFPGLTYKSGLTTQASATGVYAELQYGF